MGAVVAGKGTQVQGGGVDAASVTASVPVTATVSLPGSATASVLGSGLEFVMGKDHCERARVLCDVHRSHPNPEPRTPNPEPRTPELNALYSTL